MRIVNKHDGRRRYAVAEVIEWAKYVLTSLEMFHWLSFLSLSHTNEVEKANPQSDMFGHDFHLLKLVFSILENK